MPEFDPDCGLCPRLARHLESVRRDHPQYHARPVAPFGDKKARLLIVGLAPGLHGANRTGRAFTGEHAGILLYQSLYGFGLAERPESVSADDGLRLKGCRITNAVKCLPPHNKPLPAEIATCNVYLKRELQALARGAVVLALGVIAHAAVLKALGLKASAHRFRHGAHHRLPEDRHLLDSYHCSRYNTQTGRLTPPMFRAVLKKARALIDA